MNKNIKKINIGVVGVGHLGEHHVKHLKSIDSFKLIGIYDIDEKRADSIGKKYRVPVYKNINQLIEVSDAISLVTPTETHFDIAYNCIKAKKHIFIEKPITKSVADAEKLIKLGIKRKVVIQVGHIERFNPALTPLNNYILRPKYIEIQRLAPYNIRGTDVPVVLDKMIHDLDILLFLVNSDVESIYANGISILTDSIDIANSRIRFNNGTIANITSSRVAQDDVRKIKIFQQDLYITIDLLIGLTEVYRVVDKKEKNINAIKDILVSTLALVENEIDISEELMEKQTVACVKTNLIKTKDLIGGLLKTYKLGKMLFEGLDVIIVGETNVGKSTLFNALVKKDVSIVNQEPGTTRNLIESGY